MEQPVYFEDQVSVTVEDAGIVKADCDSDSEADVSSHRPCEIFSDGRLIVQRVEEESRDYEIVKSCFVTGMRPFWKNIDVVGIHKKNYTWNVIDEARVEAFRAFAAAVATTNGGDANIKYGWYGGSRDEIREILMYGFRRFENRSSSYGRGVYLSPQSNLIESVKTSVADSNGLRHALFCRVIIGKPEVISFGSQNDHPSTTEFNSGVDDLTSPTKYIIWEPYMNTHILPLYIISFQADLLPGFESVRVPKSPHMSISRLISHLKNHLSSSKIALLKRHHLAYNNNKISRSGFIKNLRAIVGDDTLKAIIQGLR